MLFLLSRAMILMVERRNSDVTPILTQAQSLIETSVTNVHLKEYLKVFFLILQVCFDDYISGNRFEMLYCAIFVLI